MQDASGYPMAAYPQIQAIMAQMQPPVVIESKEKRIHRKKFTRQEDEILRNLVNQFGQSDWGLIARHFQNRTPRQCRERWKHYVSPDVVTGDWTEADDQMLRAKVTEFGPRWSVIAQYFHGRTDIGVKNRYISITGKKEKDVQSQMQLGQ
jgi:hypothetical protein